ncbi:hypothetical protein JG688_00011364 [Phytophthora aleatoria]|uniref:Core-binding (CB) domain-containing protein n=1 Tax=Phytophthora aleatoria TaxID=2496075 RepID=A0A8J5IP78_9STRA|nr:hypothetical protein JG688_00011364 [Phytophthora aleatoria]
MEKRQSVSVGTLSGYRSAMKELFRRKETPRPAAYSNMLVTFFSGLTRMEAFKFNQDPKKSLSKTHCHSLYTASLSGNDDWPR